MKLAIVRLSFVYLICATIAGGAQTFHSSRDSFEAQAGNVPLITFDGLVGTPQFPANYPGEGGWYGGSAMIEGITFQAVSPDLIYILNPTVEDGKFSMDGYTLSAGRTITYVALPPGTIGFGADLDFDRFWFRWPGENIWSPTVTAVARFVDGSSETNTFGLSGRRFWGVTGWQAISDIVFNAGGMNASGSYTPYLMFDNVSYGLVSDIIASSLTWNTKQGGLDFAYSVTRRSLNTATTAKLFWANGTTVANIVSSTPVFANTIPVGFSGQSAITHIPGSLLHDAPLGTTHMLLVIDPDNLVAESNEGNNTLALADVTVVPKNDTVNMGILSPYTINAIKDSLRRAAELKAIVNSTKRSIREQALAVCGNIQKKGLAKQKLLYGANRPMTEALESYEDSLDDTPPPDCADVLTASLEASVAGGAELGSISKHLGNYSQLQAVDVSYNNSVNKKLLWSAFLANPKISKTIGPPNDPALHIEIPQAASLADGISSSGNIATSGNYRYDRDVICKTVWIRKQWDYDEWQRFNRRTSR